MSVSGCVLVVNDDSGVREMIAEYLTENGYEALQADSGEAMRQVLETKVPDVVLLDVRLGREDGLTLARYLRERYDLGIIMVTAAGDVVDRGVGLEVGADDYIAKPFDPRELRARLRSVMRRVQAPAAVRSGEAGAAGSTPQVTIGGCPLDLASHRRLGPRDLASRILPAWAAEKMRTNSLAWRPGGSYESAP